MGNYSREIIFTDNFNGLIPVLNNIHVSGIQKCKITSHLIMKSGYSI